MSKSVNFIIHYSNISKQGALIAGLKQLCLISISKAPGALITRNTVYMKFEKKKTPKVLKFFCLCTLMLMIWSKNFFYFWHTRIGHRPFGDVGPLGPLPLISSIFGPLLAFEGRVVQPLRVKIPVSNLCFSSHTKWHRPMGQCNTFVLKNRKKCSWF